ncbi:hypothetical protein WR25_06430 [Diploscapter pachys]|uniref:RBR-type E3 ubiquitin transferase n=1 Tax=Diploscapter pachys TaxID=2018661 RepID=A0A2A2K8V8_9BILA|nr:hypothetical protein WR25_06430 [Diploscapter pachys]
MDDEDENMSLEEDNDGDYYEDDGEMDELAMPKKDDMEDAECECLDAYQVERILNETVAALVESASIPPAVARMLLHANEWDVTKLMEMLRCDENSTLAACGIVTGYDEHRNRSPCSGNSVMECEVCACDHRKETMRQLNCGHKFCILCWRAHIENRLSDGIASRIDCMHSTCRSLCTPAFVLDVLSDKPALRAKYENFLFRDYVESHPHLKFCSGKDCPVVVFSKEKKAKRVTCTNCQTSFCVRCGYDYHAPTRCDVIRKWLIKCADDSETANYISAHTKDCPQCHSCIEKNGGCNHMQCAKCRHHFCWMCFGDWKTHGSEYYECSRYKENPSVAAEANHVKARRALEKYLHYFERYENHKRSLRLEEQLREKIRKKIDEKVNEHDGTWIDWQYLHRAATLLTKCRYTLQYTYPFAYYMESSSSKNLFEYQQAQLEKDVEELAWDVERADSNSKSVLSSTMARAEHRRTVLLHDFFFSSSDS